MNAHLLPGLATAIALFVYLWTLMRCGNARRTTGLKAPAVSGNEEFERHYRVQMNTIEQIVVFVPALWLFALSVSNLWAGILGLVWSAGRVVYGLAYVKDPGQRGLGFAISGLAVVVLLTGAFLKMLWWLVIGM